MCLPLPHVSRNWFLRPTTDLVILKDRHDSVEFFSDPRNLEITTALQDCLKSVKALPVSSQLDPQPMKTTAVRLFHGCIRSFVLSVQKATNITYIEYV